MSRELRRLTVHRSLVRPILLGGAERELTIINATFILMLIVGSGIHLMSLGCALILATAGQYFLTRIAKHDAQMTQVYRRHLRYQDYYRAETPLHAKSCLIHSSLGK